MKKLLSISIIVVIFILLGAVVWQLVKLKNENSEQPLGGETTTFPLDSTVTTTINTNASTTLLRTKENTYIQVNDFKQQPFVLDVGEGFYNLDGANADINLPYSILYNQNNQSFAISLNIAPLYTTRDQATAEFIKRLGITSEQACKINIYVGVPYSVDSRLSGQNLGLSYCPGNVPL